jgi:YVTN family beta-propeller protein
MRQTDSGDASLTFAVLGPFEATSSGRTLPTGGRQQRAVLALLACEAGHAVSVERLVHGVWGDSAPAGAVTSLQTYVFHLRQVLEPDRPRGSPATVLVTVPGGYRLTIDPECVDLIRFERLVADGDAAVERREPGQAVAAYDAALALWRGDLLADLADYEFVTPLRARLDEMTVSMLESRIHAELELGHHLGLVAELGALVADHPLHEAFHGQRMLALYRSGRQSDALSAYRDLRAVLDTELGIEPSAPLRELHTRMLRQDPALAGPPPRAPTPTPGKPVLPARDGTTAVGVPEAEHESVGGRRLRLSALASVLVLVAASASSATIEAVVAGPALASLPANAVVELDESGTVLGSTLVGINPIALASSDHALWVVNASEDTVSKIDTSTHAVQQVLDVGHDPRGLVVTGDDLWVTNFADGTVSRINVLSGRVVGSPIQVGSEPYAIAAGPAGLWVANSGDNTIQRIDTETGEADQPINVGDGPDGLAVDDTSVWVANGRSGSVMRFDGRTRELISPAIRVGSGPRGIVRVGDDVWVADELSNSVTRIDVATLSPHPVDVGNGPTGIAVLGGSVWVAENYSGDLVRFDSVTRMRTTVPLGAPVRGLAVADGHLWVGTGAFPSASHRGGDLEVAAASLPGRYSGIDPAHVYDTTTYQAERVVYDGLLAYHYSSADPNVLVPDLATSVPEPTDNGKTYVFNLRPGIRYSTGAEVRAYDFVRGVQRALRPSASRPDFYADIVGGHRCVHDPTHCALRKGVIADDDAGQVTFKLRAPDPQFLNKLTVLVVPAPAGTPLRKMTAPLPGTGPYQISSYDRRKVFTLTRNPYFHQWSAAAQPAGFLDSITWDRVNDVSEAADAVRRGQDDLAELTPLFADPAASGDLVDYLRRVVPNLLHPSPVMGISFGVLNSSIPPFDNPLARQAFNYAVDRRKAVRLMGGPSVAVETCQLIPPTMPSYRRYCPYSRGPRDGDYHGPDLAKAQDLVAASGTRGMMVTVTDLVDDYNPEFDAYLAHVLRKLGYRARLRSLADTRPHERFFYGPRSDIQVQSGGWLADFPLPSNFYEILACPVIAGNYRFAHCDPGLDSRAAAADALMPTEPGSALRRWTRIDHSLTDAAPILAMTNPINWWITAERVSNYQPSHQQIGPLLSQLWVH